jgi:predicted RNA-binding protein YlxR (DUF448 family)
LAGKRGGTARPVPQRTCIGCREATGKRGLLRIVRTPTGRVEVDPTGKANGRGAYVHGTKQCWEKALKGGTMGHALRTSPASEDVEALRAFGRSLPDEGVEDR